MEIETPSYFVASDMMCKNEKFKYRFIVPIYQRVFTWGDREVKRLLMDLYRHFIEGEKKEDYYLGVITVVDGGSDGKYKDLILVDGQQRVTCIMLLGALLGWELDEKRLKYEDRDNDRKAKELIYEHSLLGDDLSKFDSGNEAMNAFFRCACALNNGEINVVNALRGHAEISSRLKLFISTLPANPYESNPAEQNKYFEKMNSGGRQLEPHEILKVRICSKSSHADAFAQWNRTIDFSVAYEDSECSTDESSEICFEDVIFGDEFEDSGEPGEGGEDCIPSRSGLIDQNMFLLHVRALCDKREALDSHWHEERLIESFPSESEIDETWADDFITKMVDYREFLDGKIVHLAFDTIRNAYDYKFESDENATGVQEDDMDKEKVRQFQSMLYVSSGGKQGRQEWLLKAFKRLGRMGENYTTQLMKLKDLDKENVAEGQTSENYIDSLCYSMQSRWLFWRLDYLLWECVMDGCKEFSAGSSARDSWDGELSGSNIKAMKSFRFHTGRSIEHLHPQTDDGNTEWNEGDPPQKDMFCNLCLLTSSVNSKLSNDSVAVKLAKIKELAESGKVGLQSIKMLFMYKECMGLDSKWTPEVAQIHMTRMKKVLLDSYLYRKD